jgi:hypothetical protein
MQSDVAEPMDIIWGAAAIGRAIGVPTRRAFYLLERGLLPATKVGDSWCASRAALQKRLLGEEK